MNNFKCDNIKQQWKELIIWLVNKNNIAQLKIQKAIVTYKYYFKTKIRHDSDNYNGKFCNDGLVASGLIEDDDFDHVKMLYEGYYDKDNSRMEIHIQEIEDEKNGDVY
jgi:hypothetical protein